VTDARLQRIQCRAPTEHHQELRISWHDGYVPDKPTSEQIRREAEKLLATATKLIEHAKTLIEKSAELEKQVSYLNRQNTKRSNKP
jgi:hypothetical protein